LRNVTKIALIAATVALLTAPGHAASTSRAWSTRIVTPEEAERHHAYYRRHGNDWRRHYRHHEFHSGRPLSCGEFRFWDGTSCVDVRFR